MKYFEKGCTECGFGEKGILFDQIFSLRKTEDNKVRITEECDGYFTKELTVSELTELFDEAIYWVKGE